MLIDSHCHIHEADYPLNISEVFKNAHESGVDEFICIGTSEESSRLAVDFSSRYKETYAAVGVHPHDTKDGWEAIGELVTRVGTYEKGTSKIVAIGEIGLDYFYMHTPKETQIKALKEQIEVALINNLPIVFHVRDAFDDFWPIFDSFSGIRGVVHSFTDNKQNLAEALKRGLYVGVNGISTFTRDLEQKALLATIPLNRLLFETDAPFLTPAPFRGKVNEPAFIKNIAEHHASTLGISLNEVAEATTKNAKALFRI